MNTTTEQLSDEDLAAVVGGSTFPQHQNLTSTGVPLQSQFDDKLSISLDNVRDAVRRLESVGGDQRLSPAFWAET